MAAQTFDAFEEERTNPVKAALPWVIGSVVLAALVWFIYTQMTASGIGVTVAAPSQQQVDLLPPPPPPPPPPPEPQEKPPEPTEQPQPTPAEAPKAPQQQAAPVSINAPAQSGADAFNIQSGSGQGQGAPSSKGTCLGANCGSAPSGGGMSVGMYNNYLKSALQERVQNDPKLSRLIFTADFNVTVTPDGRVSGVSLQNSRGGNDAAMAQLAAILSEVRGLNPPPSAMYFPQRISVRGRKSAL